MDELLQLLKDANEARRQGAPQGQIDAYIAQHSPFQSHADLSKEVLRQATDPSLVAQRRQAAQAQALAPDMEASTGPLEVAANGATFGASPLLSGALEALTHPSHPLTAFREGRELAKARIDAFTQAHPKEAALESLGGGLASIPFTGGPLASLTGKVLAPLGLGAVAAGQTPSVLNLIAHGAVGGAIGGGAMAAANAPTLADAPAEALTGGGMGSLLGGVFGAATKPLTSVFADVLAPRARAFANPEAEAARQFAQRFSQQVTPADEGRLLEAHALRPGLVLPGDLNPTALDVTTQQAGTAEDVRQLIRARQEAAGPRLAQDAEHLAGVGNRMPDAVAASAAGKRAFQAYRLAHYVPLEEAHPAIDLTQHPQIAEALQNQDVASVYKKVTGEALRPSNDPIIPNLGVRASQLSPAARASLEASGQIPPSPKPSLQALQETRTNLREQLDNLPSGSPHTRQNLQRAIDQLSGAMGNEIPGLAHADAGWEQAVQMFGNERGGVGALGAFADGAQAWNEDPRVVRQQLDRLSPNAQAAYRVGMLDAKLAELRGLRAGTNAAATATERGNQSLEPHLQEAFGSPQAVDEFLRRSEVERFLNRTYGQMGAGSKTEPSAAMRQALFGNGIPGRTGRLDQLLGTFRHDAVTVSPDLLAQAGNRLLTSPDVPGVVSQLQQVRAQDALRGPMLQHLASGGGLVSGGPGKKAATLAEILGVLGLANTGSMARNLVFGHTTDRGY